MQTDYSRSRAILIGNSSYRDPDIPDLPAAAACVQAMVGVLTSDLCGWPPDRIVTFVDVQAPHTLAQGIVEAIGDVESTLLVYYVGHGMRTRGGQLALPVGDTVASPEILPYTSLLYENLAGIIQDCPAVTKLIILDCCHAELAGRATSLFRSGSSRPDLGPAEGVYFIGASAQDSKARAPLDGGITYFTSAFVDAIRSGIPGELRELSIERIFHALRDLLRNADLPEPVQSKIRDAGDYLFARNAAPARGDDWPPGTEQSFQGKVSPVFIGAACFMFLIALSAIPTGSWSSLGRSPVYWVLEIPFILYAGWAVVFVLQVTSRPYKLLISPQFIEISYGRHRIRCDWAELSRVTIRPLPEASPPRYAVFVYPRPGVRVGRGGALGPPRPYKRKGWVMFCELSRVRAGRTETAAALAQFAGRSWDPAADLSVRPGLPAGRT
jgi:Caspase domain